MRTVVRGPGRHVSRAKWVAGTVVAVSAVLALAACGGGGKSSSGAGGVAGTTATLSGQQVVATESEYRIQLSTMHLRPGPTTFVAMNKGHVAHSLEIDGPGVSDTRITGTIPPGSSKRLTVTLRTGSYEVYCPVDSHKKLGMLVKVTVSGAGRASSGTSTGSTATTTSSWG